MNMEHTPDYTELPIGFGMALAKNLSAMDTFMHMEKSRQEALIRQASQVHSKQEMEHFVAKIDNGNSFR